MYRVSCTKYIYIVNVYILLHVYLCKALFPEYSGASQTHSLRVSEQCNDPVICHQCSSWEFKSIYRLHEGSCTYIVNQ